jgi:glycerol-3-phosphate dehydrogenase
MLPWSSKANSGIVHAGYDAVPGSLKARFNVAGSNMMEKVCAELDVPFKRTGSLVLAFKGDNLEKLRALYERGILNGVKGLSLINSEQVHELEPNVAENVEAALLRERNFVHSVVHQLATSQAMIIVRCSNSNSNSSIIIISRTTTKINIMNSRTAIRLNTTMDSSIIKMPIIRLLT